MAGVKDEWTPEGKKFMEELKELASLEVRIGFQHGIAQEDNGADICDVAAWHELGTEHIPSRPFMRDSVDKHLAAIDHMFMSQKDALLSGATAKDILNTVGMFQKDVMQTEIEQGDFVANAPATIRKKKSEKPLVDSGQMHDAVNYQIVKKGSAD